MSGQRPNWQLILDAAEALTAAGQAPFTRISVYEWIWRRYPRRDHDRPSLDPTFQGMVGNAPGGPASQCGTPLHRTGRGLFVLARSRKTGEMQVTPPAGAAKATRSAGHAFISYVHEDSAHADRLQRLLEDAGVPVWRDTAQLWPGQDWRMRIRSAITRDALAFLACFSKASVARAQSYQNEELNEAVGSLRLRSCDTTWLIPVRFDDCQIPDRDIGGGRTLRSLHYADLFGHHYHRQAERLVQAIREIVSGAAQVGPRSAPGERDDRLPKASIARPDVSDPNFSLTESQRDSGKIVIQLTQGNLNNNHVYLARHLSFFPGDVIGGANRAAGTGTQITLQFDGLPGTVETDIDPKHKIFRARERWNDFFQLHDLRAGDRVVIEKIAPYRYRIGVANRG